MLTGVQFLGPKILNLGTLQNAFSVFYFIIKSTCTVHIFKNCISSFENNVCPYQLASDEATLTFYPFIMQY